MWKQRENNREKDCGSREKTTGRRAVEQRENNRAIARPTLWKQRENNREKDCGSRERKLWKQRENNIEKDCGSREKTTGRRTVEAKRKQH